MSLPWLLINIDSLQIDQLRRPHESQSSKCNCDFQGQDVGGTDFNTRLICITKEIIGPRHELMKTGQLNKAGEPFSVRAKPFWDLSCTQNVSDNNLLNCLCFLYRFLVITNNKSR
jgi:mRNA capping enzyme, catalytic domain